MFFELLAVLAFFCATDFDVLDSYNEEWVAPGYRVVVEATIDPSQYVESLDQEDDRYSCQAFFVEVNEETRWRVVVLGGNGVALLQEDQENRLFSLDIQPTNGACFSDNGRFMLAQEYVREGAFPTSSQDAVLVDLETGCAQYFSTAIFEYQGGFIVSDSGRVACIAAEGTWDMSDLQHPVRSTGPGYQMYNCSWDPQGNIFSCWYICERSAGYACFNWDGSVRWTASITGNAFTGIQPGGGLLVCPVQPSGIVYLNGRDGSLLGEDYGDLCIQSPVFSQDGLSWLAQSLPVAPDGGEVKMISGQGLEARLIDHPIGSQHWSCGTLHQVSNTDYSLSTICSSTYELGPRMVILNRFVLLAADGQLIWASPIIQRGPSIWQDMQIGLCNGVGPVSLSGDGTRIAYHEGATLRIIRITGQDAL